MKDYTGTRVSLKEAQFSFNADKFVVAGMEGTIIGQYSETQNLTPRKSRYAEIKTHEVPRMMLVRFDSIGGALQVPYDDIVFIK